MCKSMMCLSVEYFVENGFHFFFFLRCQFRVHRYASPVLVGYYFLAHGYFYLALRRYGKVRTFAGATVYRYHSQSVAYRRAYLAVS